MMLDEVRPITIQEARDLVQKYHYSKVFPRITKLALGGFKDGKLVASATLGFGTRPMHTIQKIFPSLTTADYLELGKLCVADEMPKNTESFFIARIIDYLKKEYPHLKVFFSWADGIIGKPGYIYQASNFYYGGFIWTEMYLGPDGNRVHVRSIQGHPDLPKATGSSLKTRAYAEIEKLGYKKYFGLQFRYIYPLCNKKDWKRLQAESPFQWNRGGYPKADTCMWKRQTGKGTRESCGMPLNIKTEYIKKG